VVYCLHQQALEQALAKGVEQMEEVPYWKIVQKAFKNTVELFRLQELTDT
jgi:TatD DNase family protein